MIELSENAANELKKLQKADNAEGKFLRLLVQSGGCSGFEYGMGFDDAIEGDTEIESRGIKMIIDPMSSTHLKGVKIDFNDGLHGKGFTFENPNAHSSCGCGKSFQ